MEIISEYQNKKNNENDNLKSFSNESELFINNLINKTNKLKNENYEKYDYNEPIFKKIVKKVDYNKDQFKNSVDFKNFNIDLKKRAKYEKTKAGKARIIDYEEDSDCKKVNILTDNIFAKDVNTNELKNNKINLSEMSVKNLMKDINYFIKKKNIYLCDEDMENIIKNIEDPLFEREKYIKYSKVTKSLSKLEFIKKNENDIYEVNFNLEDKESKDEKKKYVHKNFFK
jgi:hypothetical protein